MTVVAKIASVVLLLILSWQVLASVWTIVSIVLKLIKDK